VEARALSASLRATEKEKQPVSERQRDYAYEALAEVTASDPSVARGQLNAALRDIRIQTPDLASPGDSYLLSAEIHERAKRYRLLFENAALTPTALAKHWLRILEETKPRKPLPPPELHPPSNREQNLEEARKLLAKLSQ
jgi:hypothetical protein